MSKLTFKPDRLFANGARLPAIKSWLLEAVWTSGRYQQTETEDYLRSGEEVVYHLEELIATGALGVWDELQAESPQAPTVRSWLGLDSPLPLANPRAAVVFDGLSLRELPLLLKMAEDSGFRVKSTQAVATCLPSETIQFVDERVIGTRIGPSQLPGRTELAEKNVEAVYLDQPTARHRFTPGRSVLLWSTYPDRLFADDNARNETLFTNFHRNFVPTIWKNTLQDLPRGLPIVVTSDHGYVFFGAPLESTRDSDAPNLLGQARWKEFAPEEALPAWHADLQILPQTRIAMLRGRLRARPQGPSSRKLYQHGGFSLMEVLVPWIELEPR